MLKELSRLSRGYPVIDTRFVGIESDYEEMNFIINRVVPRNASFRPLL